MQPVGQSVSSQAASMQQAIRVRSVIVLMGEEVRGGIDQGHDVSFSGKVVAGPGQKIGRSSVLLRQCEIQPPVAPDKEHQGSYGIDRRKAVYRRICVARVYEQVSDKGRVGIIKSCPVASDFHHLNHRPNSMSLPDSPWPTANENRHYDKHD
jgi:hypothetical protein